MENIIKIIANIINALHDKLIILFKLLGFHLTDKELHFWVFGICGILLFIFIDIVFKCISKWSITTISFIYTTTCLVILVLAIEIQQKITGRGNMEFNDALASILGFFAFFVAYLIIRALAYLTIKLYKRMTVDNKKT